MIAARRLAADDRAIADAFYTVLSAGIVLLAGLAISSVVLNVAMHQGQAVADRLDIPGGSGLKKGLYAFYYTTDASADLSSPAPGSIQPGGYVTLRTEAAITLSKSGLPPGAPASGGMAVWAGYLCVDRAGDYTFQLESVDGSWLWVDGTLIADNHGIHPKKAAYSAPVHLDAGHHPIKARYLYTDMESAWCRVLISDGGNWSVPACYR